MKTLLVVRHAKSSWDDERLTDHDRPLNKRGHRDAPRLARWVQREGLVPDLVLSSTAVRARTTAEVFQEETGQRAVLQCLPELYLATADHYISVLGTLSRTADIVMVVGHNPGLEELVLLLAGEGRALPTAAVACITLPIDDWSDIDAVHGTVAQYWRPKDDA